VISAYSKSIFLASRVTANLFTIGNLVDNYREGDKIVLIGYSRGLFPPFPLPNTDVLIFPGSYTARALAGLLARIGIPRNVNQKSLKKLYKMYFKQELKQPGVAERVMNEYNCNYH